MAETTYGYAVLALMLLLLAVGWRLAWPVWWRVRIRTFPVAALGARGAIAILVALALAAAVMCTLLTAAVLEATAPLWLDLASASASESLRVPPLVDVFSWVTHLGDTATILMAAVAGVAMYAAYTRESVWPFALTVLGAQATTWLGKYLVDKPRPDLSQIAPAVQVVSPSFPSAHASGTLTVYGFVGYLAIRTIPKPRFRAEATYGLVAFLVLIGLSRIILGVHHATDVLGGWLLGAFWLCLGVAAGKREQLRGESVISEDEAPRKSTHP